MNSPAQATNNNAPASHLRFNIKNTKTGLVPQEDMGTIFIDVRTSPGNSLEETRIVMDDIDKRINDIPQIRMFSKVTGNGMISGQGASNGMFIIRLKPWDERKEREDGINAVINEIYRRTDDISANLPPNRLSGPDRKSVV